MNEQTTYTYSTGVLVNGSSHDGTSTGLGPNDIWFRNVPSGSGGYLWVTTVHVADLDATEVIGSGSWSAVTKLAEKGDQGKFAVEIYKRVSSAPSAPTDVTWTYSTGALTGTNSAAWALSVPSGSDQVWISSVIFDPSAAAISITTWSTPYQGGTTGAAGAAGTNNATVAIYQKNTSASSAPANPSGTFTYTFSTGVLSGGTLNSWSQTIPDLAKGEYLWMKHATASSTTATDTISHSEFSAAAITGAAGIDGSSVAVVELFKVSASNSSAPADPTGTFTYTFATNILSGGTLDGWAQNRPTVPAGQYLWAIQASAVANATTDSIPASEFSGAVVVSGTGSAGSDAKTVKLTSNGYAIVYDEDGLNPSPSSITLTATSTNTTNGFFKFTGDEITDETSFTDGATATTTTKSVTVPAAFGSWTNPSLLRVGVSEADQNELAFDRISIPAVQQGSNAYTVVVTNDSHTVPASSAGVVSSYTGSGTTFSVYRGATQLAGIASGTPNANQFSVAVSNNSDITEGSKSVAGNNIVIANHSGMSNSVDSVKIDYTITVRPVSTNIDFLKSQTITKSKQGVTGSQGNTGAAGSDGSDGTDGTDGSTGATGPTGQRETTGIIYRTATDSSVPAAPTNANSHYSFSSNTFTTLLSGWSLTPPVIDTNDTNPYYQCTFNAVETTNGGTVTETFGTPVKIITFDGIVKFTNSGASLASTVSGSTTTTHFPKVFKQANIPTALAINDVWLDTDDGQLYVALSVGANQLASGEWEPSVDATATANAATAQTTANTGVTNAATAQTTANTGVTNAATAQTKANTAFQDAAIAQSTANTATTNAATAQTQANTATTNAATAQGELNDIADDDKLTPVEKLQVKTIWDAIRGEYSGIIAAALDAGVVANESNHAAYRTANTALNEYLNNSTGSAAGDINIFDNSGDLVLSSGELLTTTITRSTFNTRFKTYYDTKQALLDAISATLKDRADLAVTNAATAQTKANTAFDDAAAANALAVARSKIIRSDTMPDALAAGDMWVDTNDDNTIYIASNANAGLALGGGTPGNWVREDVAAIINSQSSTTTIDGGNIRTGTLDANRIVLNSELTILAGAGIKSGKSSAADSSIGVFLGTDASDDFAFVTSSGTGDAASAVTISSAQTILKNPVIQTGTSVADTAVTRTTTGTNVISSLPSYEDAGGTNPWQKLTVSAVGGGGSGARGNSGGSGSTGGTTLVNIVRTVTGSTSAARSAAETAMVAVQAATVSLSGAGGAGGSGSSGSYSAGAPTGSATLGLGAGGFGGTGNEGSMADYQGGAGGTAGSVQTAIFDIKNLKELAWAAAGLETGVTAPTSADPSGDNLPTITLTINTTQVGAAGAQASGGTSPGGVAYIGGMGYVTESGVLSQLNLDSLSGVSAQDANISLSGDSNANGVADFTVNQSTAETITIAGGTGITTVGDGTEGSSSITINLDSTIASNTTGSSASATTATNVSGTVAVANGGTGATAAAAARANLGSPILIEPDATNADPVTGDFTSGIYFVVQY
jgi:hypothetical protein